jgi:hypothetical protein
VEAWAAAFRLPIVVGPSEMKWSDVPTASKTLVILGAIVVVAAGCTLLIWPRLLEEVFRGLGAGLAQIYYGRIFTGEATAAGWIVLLCLIGLGVYGVLQFRAERTRKNVDTIRRD